MLKKMLRPLLGLAAALAMATAAIAADPLKIVYIGKNTGNPYFDSITGGFEDACKALGCEFEFVAPGDRRSHIADPVHRSADPARRERHRASRPTAPTR